MIHSALTTILGGQKSMAHFRKTMGSLYTDVEPVSGARETQED